MPLGWLGRAGLVGLGWIGLARCSVDLCMIVRTHFQKHVRIQEACSIM